MDIAPGTVGLTGSGIVSIEAARSRSPPAWSKGRRRPEQVLRRRAVRHADQQRGGVDELIRRERGTYGEHRFRPRAPSARCVPPAAPLRGSPPWRSSPPSSPAKARADPVSLLRRGLRRGVSSTTPRLAGSFDCRAAMVPRRPFQPSLAPSRPRCLPPHRCFTEVSGRLHGRRRPAFDPRKIPAPARGAPVAADGRRSVDGRRRSAIGLARRQDPRSRPRMTCTAHHDARGLLLRGFPEPPYSGEEVAPAHAVGDRRDALRSRAQAHPAGLLCRSAAPA